MTGSIKGSRMEVIALKRQGELKGTLEHAHIEIDTKIRAAGEKMFAQTERSHYSMYISRPWFTESGEMGRSKQLFSYMNVPEVQAAEMVASEGISSTKRKQYQEYKRQETVTHCIAVIKVAFLDESLHMYLIVATLKRGPPDWYRRKFQKNTTFCDVVVPKLCLVQAFVITCSSTLC